MIFFGPLDLGCGWAFLFFAFCALAPSLEARWPAPFRAGKVERGGHDVDSPCPTACFASICCSISAKSPSAAGGFRSGLRDGAFVPAKLVRDRKSGVWGKRVSERVNLG